MFSFMTYLDENELPSDAFAFVSVLFCVEMGILCEKGIASQPV